MSFHEKTESIVKQACVYELAQAVMGHGDEFHSMHEGYAVLKEEYEEARGAFSDIDLDFLWECVKRGAEVNVDTIQYSVIEAMKELAQVWAVCEKIKKGGGRMTDEELEKKATLYADEHCEDKDEYGDWLFDEEMLKRAFIAGQKQCKKK